MGNSFWEASISTRKWTSISCFPRCNFPLQFAHCFPSSGEEPTLGSLRPHPLTSPWGDIWVLLPYSNTATVTAVLIPNSLTICTSISFVLVSFHIIHRSSVLTFLLYLASPSFFCLCLSQTFLFSKLSSLHKLLTSYFNILFHFRLLLSRGVQW